MYRVFRANLDPAFLRLVAFATLFLPSFVYWSSGLIKEAVAVTGFGWAFYGIHLWIDQNRKFPGWVLMVAGAFPIWLIKPYVLFPLVLAGGSWYYWARSLKRGRVRIRPAYFAMAALLGVGGIALLAQYFPEYAPDTFSSRTYELQRIGRGLRGGSQYALAGEMPTTLAGQLAYAPAALLTTLLRPSIFEVRNLMMLVNAVETTVLTLLFARVLFTRSLGNVRRQIADNPFLMFCIVFVVAFGIAVGLVSSNLGTLSRYRCLILPFFAVLLFALGWPRSALSGARAVRRSPARVLGAA